MRTTGGAARLRRRWRVLPARAAARGGRAGDTLRCVQEVTLKSRQAKSGAASALAGAVLVVGALALGACGERRQRHHDHRPATRPRPAARTTTRSAAEPGLHRPLNAQESEGMQVAHQVFQGLAKYEMNDKGEMVAVPDIAESWETTDSQTWTFTLKKGVMFQAPVSREVKAQDFVDSWNCVTDREEPVVRLLHPRARSRAATTAATQVDPKGPHRRQGDRRLHPRGQAALPLRRVPADARPHRRRGDPRRVHREDRRQGVRPEAGRHRPVHGRGVEEQPVHRARQEPELLGHGRTPATSTPSTCRSSSSQTTSGSSSRRAHRLHRTCRRARSRPPRATPR